MSQINYHAVKIYYEESKTGPYTLLGTIFFNYRFDWFCDTHTPRLVFLVMGLILISLESPVVDEWLSNLARKNK